ncbi:hypothetical protein [Amycolatopsis sp. NPDC098790]|uniref:hypothetical protein n=1 Tax=Amycolatopsis sp. NPDC098790 TaxID=3363939 RepID=UPI0038202670
MSVELNHTIVCARTGRSRRSSSPGSWAGELNSMNCGRGVCFEDPDGHNLELLTRG